MKLKLLSLVFLCMCAFAKAQVGIGTTTPQGALDIVSPDTGLVVPRVSSVENVTSPDGNPPVNGTIVYDLSTEKLCIRIEGFWLCTDLLGANSTQGETNILSNIANYIKASNTGANDRFGDAVSISTDGNYLAIGAQNEDSSETGINGNQANNSANDAGAVYVFVRSGATWIQEAYIKASNSGTSDFFGERISLNMDGTLLAVSSRFEDSNATGINGNQADNSASNSGAVYVFERSGATWTQEAYIKASNTEANDLFGHSMRLSGDGTTLAIGARDEDSNATGINGNQADNSAGNSGAVYVYTRSGGIWAQQAYIKASNTGAFDTFGTALALSKDGNTLAVSATDEDSNATGINGNQANNSSSGSGAVYVYTRSGATWSQQAYIKASNTGSGDGFGDAISLTEDGNIMAISALSEGSNAIGINGNQNNNIASASGAVYVFIRTGAVWIQEAYIKASNSEASDQFGQDLSLSSNGSRLVVGARTEDSNAIGINGNQIDNSAGSAGAAYSFARGSGTWIQDAYIKASNTQANDQFGFALALSGNGTTLVVGAVGEDSNATGVGGDQTNNAAGSSGAVYVIE